MFKISVAVLLVLWLFVQNDFKAEWQHFHSDGN
jgi:hypothetical protein